MGLHKEGILAENEVSAFKTHLLETLIASPLEHEQAVILRDKLVFLQVNF
jgi:predicted ATPase with chaperone activity